MSLKKRIYFSPLGYIISALMNIFKFIHQPYMVYGYFDIKNKVYLRNVRISSSACISHKENLNISDNVWINHYSRIDASGGIFIGEGCQIGYASAILSHSSHNAIRLNGKDYIEMNLEDRLGYIHKPVFIGEYSFIGGGSTILPGVKIGKGCVIGVGAVVNKDVPDYAIVAGVPAKIIGYTDDTDKKFFSDPKVREHYYNKQLIDNFYKHYER